MKIHGAIISPNVRKVLAVLSIKGLEYEQVMVRPGSQNPEFLEISPLGKIPGFEDGDFRISNSRVINEYIEEKFPENSVFPSNAQDKAKCRWIEEYCSSELLPCCAILFQERFLNPNVLDKPSDLAKIDTVMTDRFPAVLNYLESITPSGGYFFGTISIADISLASPLFNAAYAGFELDAGVWPKLAAFFERFKKHWAIAPLLLNEFGMIERLRGS